MSIHIEDQLRERDALLATIDSMTSRVKELDAEIEALLFPTQILDSPVSFHFGDDTYTCEISSRLAWDQKKLEVMSGDAKYGQYISERFSVDRKKYERMPDDIRDDFSEAVTRNRGTFKIKKEK